MSTSTGNDGSGKGKGKGSKGSKGSKDDKGTGKEKVPQPSNIPSRAGSGVVSVIIHEKKSVSSLSSGGDNAKSDPPVETPSGRGAAKKSKKAADGVALPPASLISLEAVLAGNRVDDAIGMGQGGSSAW